MLKTKKRTWTVTLVLNGLLMAGLLALAGCSGSSTGGQPLRLTPTDTPTQPVNGGLPADVPVYPGAQFIGNPSQSQAGFQAPASLETISSFYQQQMPQKGWKTVQVQDNGQDGIVLSFSKDTRVAHIVIAPGIGTGQSTVLITITSG